MFYKTTVELNRVLLLYLGMAAAALLLHFLWKIIFDDTYFSGTWEPYIAKCIVFMLCGWFLMNSADKAYQSLNSRGLKFSERLVACDPNLGERSPDGKYYDQYGNRITYDEGIRLINESQGLSPDIANDPYAGYAPAVDPALAADPAPAVGEQDPGPSYYAPDFTDEQNEAYYHARLMVDNENVSRQRLYDTLTAPYGDGFSSKTANRVLDYMEERGEVDYIRECTDAAWEYANSNPGISKDDLISLLSSPYGVELFTEQEAEAALVALY